jgi:hypothetical protein
MVLDGIKVNTSPTDFYPIQSVQLAASRARRGSCSARSLERELDPVGQRDTRCSAAGSAAEPSDEER